MKDVSKTTPYGLGYYARMAGEERHDNPYSKDGDVHELIKRNGWDKGWRDANLEQAEGTLANFPDDRIAQVQVDRAKWPGPMVQIHPDQVGYLDIRMDLRLLQQFTDGSILVVDTKNPYHPLYVIPVKGGIVNIYTWFNLED